MSGGMEVSPLRQRGATSQLSAAMFLKGVGFAGNWPEFTALLVLGIVLLGFAASWFAK